MGINRTNNYGFTTGISNDNYYFGSKLKNDISYVLELENPINGCHYIGWNNHNDNSITEKLMLLSSHPHKHRHYITIGLECKGLTQSFTIEMSDIEIIESLEVKEVFNSLNSINKKMVNDGDLVNIKQALENDSILYNVIKRRTLESLFISFQSIVTNLNITYSILSSIPLEQNNNLSDDFASTGHLSEMSTGELGVEFIYNNELYVVSLLDERFIESVNGSKIKLILPAGALISLLVEVDNNEIEAVLNYLFLKIEVINIMLNNYFKDNLYDEI